MLKFKNLILILAFSLLLSSPSYAQSGDLNIPNLEQAVPNIYTGGQPSLDDINTLKSMGFTLIVNVRGKAEYADWDEFNDFDEEKEVAKTGITYISIPFKGMAGLTKENAAKFHAALEANKAAGGKVLLHCFVGMRAGGLLGLHEYLYNGLSKKQAIQLAVDANTENNRKYVEKAFQGFKK